MRRVFLLKNFKFSIDKSKKVCYNTRVAGGIPKRGQMSRRFAAVDNLWISRPRRDLPAIHQSGTSLQTDFVSLLHCLFGAQTLFRFDTALRIGAKAQQFSKSQAGGIPQN